MVTIITNVLTSLWKAPAADLLANFLCIAWLLFVAILLMRNREAIARLRTQRPDPRDRRA